MIECPLFNGCNTFDKNDCIGNGIVKSRGKEGKIEETNCVAYKILLNLSDILKTYAINVRELGYQDETGHN
jgi:hypothetical protein